LWQQRSTLWVSAGNLLLGGLLPAIGVAFSIWVLIESVSSGAVSATVMLYGLGSILAGAVLAVFLHSVLRVRFFTARTASRP
jgi:hypothetical protein